MRTNNIRDIIWQVATHLRDVVFSQNYSFSALRVLFLKYVIDNYTGAKTAEDMQACARAQKMFALRDTANGLDSVIPVLEYIDKAYGLDHILSGNETIEAYGRELFGLDYSRKKKKADETVFQELLEYIGSLDLEERYDAPLGHDLAQAVVQSLGSGYERSSFSGEYVTHSFISSIAEAILAVQDDDVFLDFASGVGASTMSICGEARPTVLNAEINRLNAASAAMLYILAGFKRMNIICADSLSEPLSDFRGNKIFVEPPFTAKVFRSEDTKYSDASLASLHHIIHNYCAAPGKAVMVCQGSFLFQNKPQTVSLREELVESGMLKAVITLPELPSYSTAITVHLLVISKEDALSNDDMLFIDLAKEMKSRRNSNKTNLDLQTEIVAKVADCIETPHSVPGFCCAVTYEDVRKNKYNLVPGAYLQTAEEEDDISIDEINAQLKDLYELLQQKS